MMLPSSAEYALRAMAQVANTRGSAPLRATEIARGARIPLPFLSKILRRLVRHKLLVARAGRGGGFVIGRSPGTIRFAEILTATGYRFNAKHCVFGLKRCGSKKVCPFHHTWSSVKKTFQHWAEKTTLQDLRC